MPAIPIQPPVFVNGTNLGTIKEGDNQIISIAAQDPNPYAGVPLQYSITTSTNASTQLPPTLTLDTGSGYIYGVVSTQTSYLKNYFLTINATKTDIYQTSTFVATNIFNLSVRNHDNTTISWQTPASLETITQGSVSDLSVSAVSSVSTDKLQYRIVGTNFNTSGLPDGLSLNTSGNIVGTVTTSGVYSVTVLASTSTYISDPLMAGNDYPYPFSKKTFTIQVVPQYTSYTNIYAKPFLKLADRRSYHNFITSSTIFVPEMIYRADDPNFGVQTDIKMNLEFGIQELNLSDYYPALMENFYRRRLNFGQVKVARAINDSGVHVYDVVYVDVVDELQGSTKSVTINSNNYYPASVDNMRYRLENLILNNNIIDINKNNLPKFMKTAQINSYLPLGYVKVVILCYALPNYGSRIAARIHLSNFDFKTINFEIDRLIIENTLDTVNTYIEKNSVGTATYPNKYLLFTQQDINR